MYGAGETSFCIATSSSAAPPIQTLTVKTAAVPNRLWSTTAIVPNHLPLVRLFASISGIVGARHQFVSHTMSQTGTHNITAVCKVLAAGQSTRHQQARYSVHQHPARVRVSACVAGPPRCSSTKNTKHGLELL